MMRVSEVVTAALKETSASEKNRSAFETLDAGGDVELESLNLDSLERFEIIMQIEDAFDIELDNDEVAEQKTVQALIRFVEQRAREQKAC